MRSKTVALRFLRIYSYFVTLLLRSFLSAPDRRCLQQWKWNPADQYDEPLLF